MVRDQAEAEQRKLDLELEGRNWQREHEIKLKRLESDNGSSRNITQNVKKKKKYSLMMRKAILIVGLIILEWQQVIGLKKSEYLN